MTSAGRLERPRPRFRIAGRVGICCVFLFLFALPLQGEQIGSQGDSLLERSHRFLSLSDKSVRVVLLGAILMGLNCGTMGSLIVTRRLSLFGDTLSHAVLPGVAMGFLWSQSKDSWAILAVRPWLVFWALP